MAELPVLQFAFLVMRTAATAINYRLFADCNPSNLGFHPWISVNVVVTHAFPVAGTIQERLFRVPQRTSGSSESKYSRLR